MLTPVVDLSGRREEYQDRGLDASDMADDPIVQFQRWFAEVEEAGYWEPNAFVVSTVTADGWPSARNVLLKTVAEDGFVFFTNYSSDKAEEIDTSGRAALIFSWIELRRQVRVTGSAERIGSAESDAYWLTRPRGSQIGAWASDQSAVVDDRSVLDEAYAAEEDRWSGRGVERPDHWGGYRVRPHLVEFWQGRPNRLHDRLRYRRDGDDWILERRSP